MYEQPFMSFKLCVILSLLMFLNVKGLFTSVFSGKTAGKQAYYVNYEELIFIIYNSNTSVIYVNIFNIYVNKKKRWIVALTPLPVTIYVI